MSSERPSPTEPDSPGSDAPSSPASTGASAGASGEDVGSSTPAASAPAPSGRGEPDPLRGSRTSGIWSATIALIVLLILLAVFILQNTQDVEVSYLGWTGRAPLSATLLIAAAGGALLVAAAGVLRILQLRRRVKRERKRR